LTMEDRVQAALVVVRGKDMVNLNLVIPASLPEEEVQTSALALVDAVVAKLPAEYTLTGAPTTTPTETATDVQPTSAVLLPPYILSPTNGQKLSNYPRNLTLDWEEVPGAVSYEVQLEACDQNGQNCFDHPVDSDPPRITTATSYSFSFVGAQPGRWRVRAIDANGIAGEWSSWWTFTFTQ
jgi:eukaryotic-like serine/threonine-protein kinase